MGESIAELDFTLARIKISTQRINVFNGGRLKKNNMLINKFGVLQHSHGVV